MSIGDHAVLKLHGERILEEIAPGRFDEPQPFRRRHESAIDRRPGIVDETSIKTGDQRAEIDLKQQ